MFFKRILLSLFPTLFCLSNTSIHPFINAHSRSACLETRSFLGPGDLFWSINFEYKWYGSLSGPVCNCYVRNCYVRPISALFFLCNYDEIIPCSPVPLAQVSVQEHLVWIAQLAFQCWTIGKTKIKTFFTMLHYASQVVIAI